MSGGKVLYELLVQLKVRVGSRFWGFVLIKIKF